jgi:hypothetical protein
LTKHTILFLAANPSGTDPRALDREARSIRAELKRSGYRDRFEFETRWAAEPLDLLRELRDLKPTVVHFSGRGSHDGLLFQTAEGRAQVVSPAAIAETFEGEYVVLLHEGLLHGAEIVIDSPRLRELRVTRTERNQLVWLDPEPITDDAHRDPVPGFEGRWLAGFAPVGDTGFVVIVQTHYNVAVEPNARLSRRLASRTAVVLLAWIALCAAGVWLYLRRRSNARPSSPG